MIDLSNEGHITFQEFDNFQKHFFHMYGEITQQKVEYGELQETFSRKIFEQLCIINGESKTEKDPQTGTLAEFFDF
jgi:hypothetical protein